MRRRRLDSTAAPLSEALGGRWPNYDGMHALDSKVGDRWYTRVSRPFPDSVVLTVSERVPRG